jgi:transposase
MEENEFIFYVDWTEETWYCGMDVHKHKLAIAMFSPNITGSEGLKTAIFSVTTDGLIQFWNFAKKYRPVKFAMEATGIYHHLPYKYLTTKRSSVDWKFDVIIVNPADAAGIPGRNKNDKVDSINLAKYLASGLLKKGKPIVDVLEDLKAIFRMGKRLKKDMTALKNRIKKNLDRAGLRMKSLDLSTIWTIKLLYYLVRQEKPLGEFLSEALKDGHPLEKHRYVINKNMEKFQPYLAYGLTHAQRILIRQDLVELDFKSGREAIFTVEIEQMILDYPQLRRHASNLASIPGISKSNAVWIIAEIGSINQFKNYRSFTAYCGCCPRVVSSADKIYSAHASKHSNIHLRKIFYFAAVNVCTVLKAESELKNYANRVFQRKSKYSKKLAFYTVATKLARIAYAILQDGKPFSPSYLERRDNRHNSGREQLFSIVERKTIRRARNCLRRVIDIEGVEKLGILGDDAKNLAGGLEKVLSEM